MRSASFDSPLLLALLLIALVASCSNATVHIRTSSLNFEAGDQFGAVSVCGGSTQAIVGGFRANVDHQNDANVFSVSLENDGTLPQPEVKTIDLEQPLGTITGGQFVAPGNDKVVYAIMDRQAVLYAFELNDSCTGWSSSAFEITPPVRRDITNPKAKRGAREVYWPRDGTVLFASATIGTDTAVFAGGVGSIFSGSGVAVRRVGGSEPYEIVGFDIEEWRAGQAGVSIGDEAWFVGGYNFVLGDAPGPVNFLNTIDRVNSSLKPSTVWSLTEARSFAAAGYAAGKVVVAGGANDAYNAPDDDIGFNFTQSVEVIDVKTGQVTKTVMPGPARGFMAAVAVNDFIIFAGGLTHAVFGFDDSGDTAFIDVEQKASDAVDVYHVPSGQWATTSSLPGGARAFASGIALTESNLGLITPGSHFNGSEKVYTSQIDAIYVSYTSGAASLSPSGWFASLLSVVF